MGPNGRPLLRILPERGQKFHALPKHGNPSSVAEYLIQTIVKYFAFLPVYTALLVTIIIVILAFDIHI